MVDVGDEITYDWDHVQYGMFNIGGMGLFKHPKWTHLFSLSAVPWNRRVVHPWRLLVEVHCDSGRVFSKRIPPASLLRLAQLEVGNHQIVQKPWVLEIHESQIVLYR